MPQVIFPGKTKHYFAQYNIKHIARMSYYPTGQAIIEIRITFQRRSILNGGGYEDLHR